ncbi:zonular occludens toxin domain-containing protein [Ramlibacter humi]|uniref:Zonular occludens toxin n=1 Tax=Ramlibacter humi TaxID=2530451 RepID=A0A4Z0BI48_9BURK|nr:zonular occludens toxin domain-containing protein [Ramlibacter humi]TFY99006.1 zonular occludens toxin [Ramlibacter humi]
MAIYLYTGAPGNGKTLLLLWDVERRRQAENRQVFYSGIRDLLLPWQMFGDEIDPQKPWETDASKWYELPVGSIIVIDEAQRLYRTRSMGSAVPPYVAALETHRHKGYDIYLVTQHPMLVDTNVRKLVETHRHLMRKFGSKWATIHEWKGVKENCDKTRKDSQETEFVYPKEVFTWYKSAEVHTHKMRVPRKVLLLAAMPFVLAGAAWLAWTKIAAVSGAKPVVAATAGGVSNGAVSVAGSSGVLPLSREAYAAAFQPRFDGLPYSAPRYDTITRPTRAPVPVGCVLYGGDGKGSFCITQQGTKFSPPLVTIRDYIAKGGLFLDFEPEAVAKGGGQSGGQSGGQAQRPAAAAAPGATPS